MMRSRVLINCSDSELDSILGTIVLGLADHIDSVQQWSRLRFVIHCTYGRKHSVISSYQLHTFIGNSQEYICAFQYENGSVYVREQRYDLSNFSVVLSDPLSLNVLWKQVEIIVNHLLSEKEESGWKQFG